MSSFTDLEKGITDVDIVMMLRIQNERISDLNLPSKESYFEEFGLTYKKLELAKPEALVLHPGPINRGVELASDVADSEHSIILEQVQNGVAVRMAVLYLLAGSRN